MSFESAIPFSPKSYLASFPLLPLLIWGEQHSADTCVVVSRFFSPDSGELHWQDVARGRITLFPSVSFCPEVVQRLGHIRFPTRPHSQSCLYLHPDVFLFDGECWSWINTSITACFHQRMSTSGYWLGLNDLGKTSNCDSSDGYCVLIYARIV